MTDEHRHAKIKQEVAAVYYRFSTQAGVMLRSSHYQRLAAVKYKEARRLMGLEGAE